MYDKKQGKQNAMNTAPPYPPMCSCGGCSNETDIAMMRVFNKNTGKTEINSFSGHNGKPAYGKYIRDSNSIVMHEQFDFRGWVTRCGTCYRIDLQGHGKQAIDYSRKHAETQGEADKVNNKC